MKWLLIGMFTALAVWAQTPAEKAQALNTKGNRVAESGDEAGAERLYREAIGIWRGLGAGYEAHLAGTLLNLGVAMTGEGQRVPAAEVFEEALALHRRSLGTTHHRTVANMNLLAANYLMMGDGERAEALYLEAMPIERELYARDIQTARTLEGLAYGLVRQRRTREALPLAEEALRIAIQCAGENGMDTALAYSSVAEVHRAMGSGERALPLYRRARFLYEKALGPEHPRVAAILSQEGLILMQDGKLALAEQSMTGAVTILQKACPGCFSELSIAQSNLGLLRMRQKRYREADEALSSAVDLREKFAVKPGVELADALQNLALVRQKEHLPDDAARLSTRAQTIRGYR